MRKIIILAFMGMTAMSFSRGINFKAGLDSYRTVTTNKKEEVTQGSGFVLGLEGMAFDSRYVDLGLGLEYNGGWYLNKYDTKIGTEDSTKTYAVPIYGLMHINIYRNENAKVYPFARLGYAISKLNNNRDLSGVYYGIGLGINIKNFIFEGLYDGIYGNKEKDFTHKIGVRLGYSLDFDKIIPKKVKTDAEKTVLVNPVVTEVVDLSNLTKDEKISVAMKVKEANKEAPIKEIKVDRFGNVLIIYNDNSTSSIDKSNTVKQKEIVKTDAEKTVLVNPVVTEVVDLSNLTKDEKISVAMKVKEANKNAPIREIAVDRVGNVLVIYNDNSTSKIDKSNTVKQKEIVKTDAEKTVLVDPERTEVADLLNLTNDEKVSVAMAVKEANKEAPIKEIAVDGLGNVLVTYNDNSTSMIDKSKTVREKEIEVVKGSLPTNCTKDEKKCIIRGFKIDGKAPSVKEQESLREIAEVVNKYAVNDIINIVGHTDSTGTKKYNQDLSVERAETVAKLLRKYGLKEGIKFGVVKGKGELDPMDTNRTRKGRYNNRRVVLTFDKLNID